MVAAGQRFSETVNCSNVQLKSKHINGEIFSSQPIPKRSRPRTRSSASKSHPSASAQSTPSVSIENLSRSKSKAHQCEKTELLHPYFSATGINRRQVAPRNTPIHEAENDRTEEEEKEEEDAIEDDVSELGFPRRTNLRSTTKFVLDRRKQKFVTTSRVPDSTSSEKHQSSSQVLAVSEKDLSDKLSLNTANSSNRADLKPWAEKYGPSGPEELTVHKKKVADVRDWIENFWQDGNQKVNGCGKPTPV